MTLVSGVKYVNYVIKLNISVIVQCFVFSVKDFGDQLVSMLTITANLITYKLIKRKNIITHLNTVQGITYTSQLHSNYLSGWRLK